MPFRYVHWFCLFTHKRRGREGSQAGHAGHAGHAGQAPVTAAKLGAGRPVGLAVIYMSINRGGRFTARDANRGSAEGGGQCNRVAAPSCTTRTFNTVFTKAGRFTKRKCFRIWCAAANVAIVLFVAHRPQLFPVGPSDPNFPILWGPAEHQPDLGISFTLSYSYQRQQIDDAFENTWKEAVVA
jgi:hypothetical protein